MSLTASRIPYNKRPLHHGSSYNKLKLFARPRTSIPSLRSRRLPPLCISTALILWLWQERLPKALNGVRAGGWVHTVADAFDAHEKKYVLFIFASVRA